jgi:hypothetical protein
MQHSEAACLLKVPVGDKAPRSRSRIETLPVLQGPELKYNYHDLRVKRRFFAERGAPLSLQEWNALCWYIDLEMLSIPIKYCKAVI